MERKMNITDNVVGGRGNEVKHTENEDHGGGNGCELDLLFLVHSDITSVLRQIDELVVEATKIKTISKQGTKDVESFRSVLSDMLFSLKPWVPRLHEAISDCHLLSKHQEEQSLTSTSNGHPIEEEYFDVDSPEHTQFESLVSPSPLVSWRGGYNVDKSRQLFLLTPLPLGKSEFLKHQNASKLTSKKVFPNAAANQPLEASKETIDVAIKGESTKIAGLGNSLSHAIDFSESLVESEPLSSPVLRRKLQAELLMTPCLKMSPPKSYTLLKPDLGHLEKQGDCKSTCSQLGASKFSGSQNSGSSRVNNSANLRSKFPELLGIQHGPITRKMDLESSPNWSFSPPKTCVLLEPMDETRKVDSFAFPVFDQEAKHTKERNIPTMAENTPLLKEPESIMCKTRRAGESTLKKELWARFEEASIHDIHYNNTTTMASKGNTKKGFLEMLEEVSGNEETEELR